MPDVDVVIVNYRSAAHTAACVGAASMVARADGAEVKIIVVNNGDDPSHLESLVRAQGPAEMVHNSSNQGFGAACNIGAARGSAPLILFLNPDALTLAGYFKTTIAFMRDPANRDSGIVGPAIENETGAVTPTCSPLPSLAGLLTRSLGLTQGFHAAALHAHSGAVGQVMGAALMIRRAVFEQLDGFDARYFLYYEDVDLCARAAAIGAGSYYLTDARVRHIGRVSSSQDSGMALALYLRSRFTYARLHFGVAAQALLVAVSYVAELPLRLLNTLFGGRSITGKAVLRAYRLLSLHFLSGTDLISLGARGRNG